MAKAEEFQRAGSDIFVWEAYEQAVKCELTSCALRLDRSLVFVDPIRLEEEALEELCEIASPSLIVCTNANHARNADYFRKRFCIPVAAHADAIDELEVDVDETFGEGFILPGQLEAVRIHGGSPGEVALRSATGALCVGDAVLNFPSGGLSLLPEKYCENTKELRASVQKLLRWEFDVITFAHGLPLVANARPRLQSLLA